MSKVINEKIGFIGGGNMAFAIGSGLLRAGIVSAQNLLVSGPHIENLKKWEALGVAISTDNQSVISAAQIIFICVKPQMLPRCSSDFKSTFSPLKVYVSILAGVSIEMLKDHLANNFDQKQRIKLIRSMPNTSMQVAEGCTVYTGTEACSVDELAKIDHIFNSLGTAALVEEKLINASTGLSGCGPAYVYTIIEALADGGVKQGLTRDMAIKFAAQTVLGAAKTVLETGKHTGVLKDEVCSPGGATIYGVHELEKGQIRATLINAVEKASERAKALNPK